MRLVFLGGENPSHRNLLTSMGVKRIGVNFFALQRRGLPKNKPYLFTDPNREGKPRFPDDVEIYVDPGSIKASAAGLSREELETFAADYEEFIVNNAERITAATELDIEELGKDFIAQQRRSIWADFGEERFWPVWHHEDGFEALESLAQRYPNIAIPGKSIEEETTLATRVRALTANYGTSWHALAHAKPDDLRSIPFDTVSSLAWVTPMRRGETIVFENNNQLKRYPKKMKDVRRRLSAVVSRAGLDYEKILADDPNEVTRLAIWSYLELEKQHDSRPLLTVLPGGKELFSDLETALLSSNSDDRDDPGNAETGYAALDNSALEVRNERPVHQRVPNPRETPAVNLPVVGLRVKQSTDVDQNGVETVTERIVVDSNHANVRQCNTCFVAANCPAFTANSECAFNFPIELRTAEQFDGLVDGLIEMQSQRVAFASYFEQLNGGPPDPAVSQEMDRLVKMIAKRDEMHDPRTYTRFTVEQRGGGGLLQGLFGRPALPQAPTTTVVVDSDMTNHLLDGGF
jgi:hypothetical protein